MMTKKTTIHTLLTLLYWTTTQVAIVYSQSTASPDLSFEPICSDCWCTTHGLQTCPAVGTDYHYHIPGSWKILETFHNVGDTIVLQAPDASPLCSPFKDLLQLGEEDTAKLESFEEFHQTQCELSPPQTGNYCGYKYSSVDNTHSCENRDYTMVSYDTVEALKEDGAHLVHAGACGVCSNAPDVWTKMNSLDNIGPRTVFCAVSFITSRDFQGMWDCMYDIGYSRPCAFQWAHYAVLNAYLCSGACLPDSNNNIPGNGPAPDCGYSDCILCATERYALDETHYTFTGYSGLKGGVVDRTPAHNCSLYQAVNYDPCVGAVMEGGGGSENTGSSNGNNDPSSDAPSTFRDCSTYVVATWWMASLLMA